MGSHAMRVEVVPCKLEGSGGVPGFLSPTVDGSLKSGKLTS